MTVPLAHRTGRRGGTLTELMVAVVVLSIGVLGLFGSFRFIARSTMISRAQSLSANLAQERVESLKNLNYYALLITTTSGNIPGFTPNILYDTVNYAPEVIQIGGITFTRYTHVAMAELSGSDITQVSATYPDTGLKQITVNVVWSEQGSLKKMSLNNLLENPNINPLDSTISGTVSNSAGGTVAGAVVIVEQNADWGATAASNGTFSFSVYHGTYSLRASSGGFNDNVSGSIVANRGATTNVPITLSPVATGYLYGTLWYNSNVVISQVVAATNTQVFAGATQDVEYVELYNPTTYPINIGTTGQTQKNVMLTHYYWDAGPWWEDRYDSSWYAGSHTWDMVNVTTYVAPGRYYLIANASYFLVSGGWVNADAYYDSTLSYPDYIENDEDGTIALYSWFLGSWLDSLGWSDNSGSPYFGEGTTLPNLAGYDGLGDPAGQQLVRVSSPGISEATLANYGRSYDSNSNTRDFLHESSIIYPPKSMDSGPFITLTGKVPTNAYVSAADPNSGSTTTFLAYITSATASLPYARFQLAGVSTGSWTVAAAYGNYAAFIDTGTILQNKFTGVPSATSTPSWSGAGLFHVQLNSSTLNGFVKGVVTNPSNQPIANITVQGGGSSKLTGSNGAYFMPVSSGTITLIANPNNSNAAYIQAIETPLVSAGAVTTQDFILSFGGRITGYVTTGTTPLAYQPITAVNGLGSQAGSAVTDTGGIFTLRNISTGTYSVFPVLESGQDVDPNTLSVTLTSTGSIFIGTFTVAGAFGSISGTVSDASGLVTSGALLIASTNTIASTPAAIVGSSAPAQSPLYMASSKADGTYLLPVRGGSTYNLSAYVPVISPSGSVSITTKTYAGIVVAPSVTTTQSVTIP